MRKFIDIINESTSTVPDLRQYVTPELINEIIDQNRWVHHGADLDDWLDSSMYASDNADSLGLTDDQARELEQMPHEEARHTDAFRKCVEHWVNMRVDDVQRAFTEGEKFDKIGPFNANTILTRCIRAETAKSQLGVYWTEHSPQSIVRLVPDHETHPVLILQTQAKDVHVDWYETLRSRLDYSNGCDEAEVQLVRGSPVANIRVGMMKYRSNGHNDHFDEGKIIWRDDTTSGTA